MVNSVLKSILEWQRSGADSWVGTGLSSSLHPVACFSNPFIVRTVRAAEEPALTFNAMADNSASTVKTGRSQCLNGTFKAIKGIVLSFDDDLKRFIVGVVANHACTHTEVLP